MPDDYPASAIGEEVTIPAGALIHWMGGDQAVAIFRRHNFYVEVLCEHEGVNPDGTLRFKNTGTMIAKTRIVAAGDPMCHFDGIVFGTACGEP